MIDQKASNSDDVRGCFLPLLLIIINHIVLFLYFLTCPTYFSFMFLFVNGLYFSVLYQETVRIMYKCVAGTFLRFINNYYGCKSHW